MITILYTTAYEKNSVIQEAMLVHSDTKVMPCLFICSESHVSLMEHRALGVCYRSEFTATNTKQT